MKIIVSVSTTPPVPNQQQQPIGYLGWELPLLAGFALGIAMASVRGKEQSEINLSSQTKERVPVPVELTRDKPPIPEQKVSDAVVETEAETIKHYQDPEHLLQMLLTAGDVSLLGGKGSGKTTMTAYLLRERIKMGHLIILFNHHAVMTFYNPLYCFGRDVPEELIGKPSVMANLEECQLHIAIGLHKCQQLMDYRYTLYKSGKLKGEPAITVLFEEMGEYDGVETELKQIRAAIVQNQKAELEPYDGLTPLQVASAKVPPNIWQQTTKRNLISSRKGEIFTITTSQDDTNKMSGNLQGMQELRKRGVVRLKLIPKPGTDGKQGAIPSGKGELTLPGLTDNKNKQITIKVNIPDLRERLPGNSETEYFDFSAIATTQTNFDLWNFDVNAACAAKGLSLITAESDEELADVDDEEPQEENQSTAIPINKPPFVQKTAEQIKAELKELIERGAPTDEIILQLWNVTPQSEQKYKLAVEWIQKMVKDLGLHSDKSAKIKSDIDRELLDRIVEIISKSENALVSFNAIRTHRSWKRDWNTNQPGTAQLRQALKQLVSENVIRGDEVIGYSLATNK